MNARDLDRDIRAELVSLGKHAADAVARRLVATGELLAVDPERALAHALAARRAASRLGVVREAVGLAAYQAGQWQLALSELRAYHRMSSQQAHLAIVADCERAAGRPERAVDTFRHVDRKAIGTAEWVELLIVAAGARRDLGQLDASVTMLQVPELRAPVRQPWQARLVYAYADALLAVDRRDEAREWFGRAVALDTEGETDAADRLLDLEGVLIEGDDTEDDDVETEDVETGAAETDGGETGDVETDDGKAEGEQESAEDSPVTPSPAGDDPSEDRT